MQNLLKFIKNKAVLFASLFNLVYLLFYGIIMFGPRTGGFANIQMITGSYYFFPTAVFLASFLFVTLREKIIFNFLSMIVIFILLLYDFILPSFDLEAKLLLLAYLMFPIVSALLAHFISGSIKNNKEPRKNK